MAYTIGITSVICTVGAWGGSRGLILSETLRSTTANLDDGVLQTK